MPPQVQGHGLGGPDHAQGDEQPQHSAARVRRAVKAKGQPPLLLVYAVSYQRVAGGSADAFAHPVGPAHGHDRRPGVGKVKEGLDRRREAIASDGQPFARPEPVRKPAGKDLEQAGGRLGDALDKTDDARPHTQHVAQKEGQDVDHHLAGDVHEETGQAHRPDVAGQGAPTALAGRV